MKGLLKDMPYIPLQSRERVLTNGVVIRYEELRPEALEIASEIADMVELDVRFRLIDLGISEQVQDKLIFVLPRIIAYAASISPRQHIRAQVRAEVLAAGKCVWCGSTDKLSVDHIYPVSLGGTNDPDNLQCLCQSCNSRKSNKVH
jgi:HNH endonuclease